MIHLTQQLFLEKMEHDHIVLARMYANGSWHQFSGKDVCSHIYLAAQYWEKILEDQTHSKKCDSLIFIAKNSYHTFIASLGAIFKNLNVIWLSIHDAKLMISSVANAFPYSSIVTDLDDTHFDWSQFHLPVIGIHSISWLSHDNVQNNTRKKIKTFFKRQTGNFCFVTKENKDKSRFISLSLDTFIKTAKNFIDQAKIPEHIPWHSAELMHLDQPFAHLSKFCAMIKNGIIGFPGNSEIDTSLSIIKPTYLFAGSEELNQLTALAQLYSTNPSNELHIKIKKTLNKFQKFLGTSKAMKIPENIFAVLKQTMRATSRLLASKAFMPNGLDNLRFIVHGLSPATKHHFQLFESYGIPVIETYGSPLAAGMLASNTFVLPHFNIIGSPLAHVYFRLGAQSNLEYKLSPDFAESSNDQTWHKTSDTVQMTPFGLMLAAQQNKSVSHLSLR